jgi:hypothetical protein
MDGWSGRWTCGAAVVLVATAGCAQRAGDLDAGATAGGRVEAVEPDELVPLLISEADGIEATAYGPRPMTAAEPGDEDYYVEPPTECETGDEMEFVASDDVYAYMGDGGDYLTIDQWITGESAAAAGERFAAGAAAIQDCVVLGEEVAVDDAGVDGVRRYDIARGDTLASVVYAHHGGVVMLLSVSVSNTDRFDQADVDHLVDVALGKLEERGRIEVPG